MSDKALASLACGLSQAHLAKYQNHYIHTDIANDFAGLKAHADKAGFTLTIASAYRDFQRQMLIWNNKYLGVRPVLNQRNEAVDLSTLSELEKCHAIMLFSALPGASRHHLGTDLDVYAKNCLKPDQALQLEPWEYHSDGPFYEFNHWLDENLAQFGFFRPYAQFNGGVAAEPWHISHIEVANKLAPYQSIVHIKRAIQSHDVAGKQVIIDNLDKLHAQYIENVCQP